MDAASGAGAGGVCARDATAIMAVTHAAALTGLLDGGRSDTRPLSERTHNSCADDRRYLAAPASLSA